jgi:hypothetical protein
MPEPAVFYPHRRRGLVVHLAAITILGGLCAACLLVGLRQAVGAYFVLLMLLSLVFFTSLMLFLYRGYALLRARYLIERDGLRLRWGLRAEDIPIHQVEWVRRAADLAYALPLPLLRWPGALLGSLNVRDLGPVEFLGADVSTLLLVATPKKIFAISPADPDGFMRSFRGTIEMGSIEPLESMSVQPVAYLQNVWQDRAARWMWGLGIGLTLLLFIAVSLAIPGRIASGISLGYAADGSRLPPVPAEQMLLLAILGAFSTAIDIFGGLFFYRQPGGREIAYILWATGVVTPLLLLLAAGMML